MDKIRTLTEVLLNERSRYSKMLFVTGPRQVGKTTVLEQLRKHYPGRLLNWDNLEDRKIITQSADEVFATNANLYFDEIHKQPRWKNFLKGYYDKYGKSCNIHVTGSARLDIYRRGGDSLLGRYLLFRLHPYTVGEAISGGKIPAELTLEEILEPKELNLSAAAEAWSSLKLFGGFPESFLRQEDTFTRRWHALRLERLVREDIRDATRIRELALLEQLVTLLPDRVAQPLSLNSLRRDLEVSHDSVRLWTQSLEDFYYLFFIPSYSKHLSRASQKERKVYLWDYSELTNPGARFENMVASHLLKWAHTSRDLGHREIGIHFVKNKMKQEVDFLITQNKKPYFLIEAKLHDENISDTAVKIAHQLGDIPVIHIVDSDGIFRKRRDAEVPYTIISASRFFAVLP